MCTFAASVVKHPQFSYINAWDLPGVSVSMLLAEIAGCFIYPTWRTTPSPLKRTKNQ